MKVDGGYETVSIALIMGKYWRSHAGRDLAGKILALVARLGTGKRVVEVRGLKRGRMTMVTWTENVRPLKSYS